MSSRRDPRIETNHPGVNVLNRSLDYARRVASPTIPTPRKLMLVLALGIAATGGARAAEQMPEGMEGWTYHIGLNKLGYAASPHQACALSAKNHMGAGLRYMKAGSAVRPSHHCFYPHFMNAGGVSDFFVTRLYCQPGYSVKAPGVCVKWPEPPRPPSCSPDQPGFSVGNPVAVVSGAKIQTEADFQGALDGALRITRTYRTLRHGGTSQSGGQGWSFSFDRNFNTVLAFSGKKEDPPSAINGTFGDGAYFHFDRQAISGCMCRNMTNAKRYKVVTLRLTIGH